MTLVFPNQETLQFAILSGLIPQDVVAKPVQVCHGATSEYRLTIDHTIEHSSVHSSLNIAFNQEEARHSSELANWLHLFPVRKAHTRPETTSQTPILFESSSELLSPFVNELLRQGNDRFGVLQHDDRVFVHTLGPPYYTLLSVIDDHSDAIAYCEAAPRVWVQYGFEHVFADKIDMPEDCFYLLRPGCEWETIPVGEFRQTADILEVHVETIQPANPASWHEPWDIPIAMAPSASTELPTMWIVRNDALRQIDSFVQNAESSVLDRLLFALTDANTVVLRQRPFKQGFMSLDLNAEPFRPWLRLHNLFVPIGQRIEPPLRRDALQKMLAPDPAQIVWISDSGGELRAESLPDSVFQPLSTWVNQILERERPLLMQWSQEAVFEFGGIALDSSLKSPAADKKPIEPRTAPKADPKKPDAGRTPKERRVFRRQESIHETRHFEKPADTSEAREKLTELEAHFLAVDGPLDHSERRSLWPEMAKLNSLLGMEAEATLLWSYSVWDVDPPYSDHIHEWVATHHFDELELDRVLNLNPATPADARHVAKLTIAAASQPISSPLQKRLPALQSFLLTNERMLPVRLSWLAWQSYSILPGHDVLSLARARDRLLRRLLERGLDADADLPAFLRFAGRADSDRLRGVRSGLEDIRGRVRTWYASQRPIDLNRDATAAYIDLLFAFGLARLGEASAARALAKHSETILENIGDDTHEAHLVLMQALNWRVEQVLGGLPHSGPLPRELLDYTSQLHSEAAAMPRDRQYELRRTCPYAIERFRAESRILEPLEKFDPYRHTRQEGHELVREASRLPDLRDASSLTLRIRQLLRPTEGVPELRIRVLAECVPLAGRLGVEPACELLESALQTINVANPTNDGPSLEIRLRLLERSLFFSAHYDRSDLAPVFVDHLVRLVETDAAVIALQGSGYALGQTLRSLRKLGLRDQTVRILERLETALLQGHSIDAIVANPPRNYAAILQILPHIAGSWISTDHPDRGRPLLRAAIDYLRAKNVDVARPLYVQILCNVITALGYLPQDEARSRIGELFETGALMRLVDTFTTSRFYSRFHLNVAESVVLTLSGEDFTLGPAARRWLDEDEYLIRRRVHRDVRSALERASS